MLRNLFSRLQIHGTAWSNIQSYNRNIVTFSCLHCNRKDAKPNSANIEYPGAGSGPIDVEESIEPYIPAYPQREGESLEILKARLLYQSRKRGMLENCLLLSTFASKFLESMNEGELKDYDRLINQPTNDWDIYYWATGVKPIPTDFDTPIMKKFILHVQNANRESRIMQPALYES